MSLVTEAVFPIVDANGSVRWESVIAAASAFEQDGVRYEVHEGLVTDSREARLFRVYYAPDARSISLTALCAHNREAFDAWVSTWGPA